MTRPDTDKLNNHVVAGDRQSEDARRTGPYGYFESFSTRNVKA